MNLSQDDFRLANPVRIGIIALVRQTASGKREKSLCGAKMHVGIVRAFTPKQDQLT